MKYPRFRFIHKNQRGFTLIEMLVVLVLIGIISGGITAAISQVLTINSRASNHMIAVRQVQQAGKEVSKDTLQAQSVNATGGQDILLTLTWQEWADGNTTGNNHTVIYTLIDMPSSELKKLQREHYINSTLNSTNIIAEYIDDTIELVTLKPKTRCDLNGNVLTFTVTATLGSGSYEASETRIYEIEPRPD